MCLNLLSLISLINQNCGNSLKRKEEQNFPKENSVIIKSCHPISHLGIPSQVHMTLGQLLKSIDCFHRGLYVIISFIDIGRHPHKHLKLGIIVVLNFDLFLFYLAFSHNSDGPESNLKISSWLK